MRKKCGDDDESDDALFFSFKASVYPNHFEFKCQNLGSLREREREREREILIKTIF